jgi:hypothetical protein
MMLFDDIGNRSHGIQTILRCATNAVPYGWWGQLPQRQETKQSSDDWSAIHAPRAIELM